MLNKFDITELSLDEMGAIEEYISECMNDCYECGNYCGKCVRCKEIQWLNNNIDECLEEKFRG